MSPGLCRDAGMAPAPVWTGWAADAVAIHPHGQSSWAFAGMAGLQPILPHMTIAFLNWL